MVVLPLPMDGAEVPHRRPHVYYDVGEWQDQFERRGWMGRWVFETSCIFEFLGRIKRLGGGWGVASGYSEEGEELTRTMRKERPTATTTRTERQMVTTSR